MSTTIAPSIETIESTVLDNGLRVFVKPDSRAPIAVSQIWYRVGSSYEQRGVTGISHLLEHMMFKGTPRYPEGVFSEIVSRQGSRENAFTGRDFTAYFEILAADRLPVAFELEADRMANLDIRAEALQTERQVVLEERRLRTDDRPEGRFLERYGAVAEAGTAYAHPVIGWADDINAIDEHDLKHWYRQWYTPANANLVVTGAVDPSEVFELAEAHFGILQGPQAAQPCDPRALTPPGERRLVYRDAQSQLTHLRIGYRVPSFATAETEEDAYALMMLAVILDGGEGGRLTDALVRGSGQATIVSSAYNGMTRLDAEFTCHAVCPNNQTETLEQSLKSQIARLSGEPISESELRRARSQLIADHFLNADDIFNQAMQIGQLEAIGAGWETFSKLEHKVQSISQAQLQAVAGRYLKAENSVVGILSPFESEAKCE
jgi:zinc protease